VFRVTERSRPGGPGHRHSSGGGGSSRDGGRQAGPQIQDSGDQRAQRRRADPGQRPLSAFLVALHGVRLRLTEPCRNPLNGAVRDLGLGLGTRWA
jgi:hypothetical protein